MSVITKRWKGKARETALARRDEGPGGPDGIVLTLDQVGGGIFDVAYTLPVQFGPNGQQFSLQVDTGSSDLWVASTTCSTPNCRQTSGRLYDPSQATQTGFTFTINYLQGLAEGPIVWDRVSVGGYSIETQAFSAASNVQNEPLSSQFTGILGLALPLNSIIASTIPAVTTNDPDGAAWASNLFSITPVQNAPTARFLSMAFARPGSDRVPSVLGIGRHPSELVPDPSLIQYTTLLSERTGTLFWKVSVRAINVYVDGERRPIELGRSSSGGVFPSAIIDSGIPLILTTSTVANAIYGAIGISPGSDGRYYVPCTTPLNMTITIDNRPEIPLHPLDLTGEPPEDNRAAFCTGLIQTADAELTNPLSAIGDMILGIPFLRNVYTVMAYTPPQPDGTFVHVDDTNRTAMINPRIGLLPLTDPTIALQEFHNVRVLNQPIGTSSPPPTNGHSNTINLGPKQLSVGIVVLISLLSFFALCCVIFSIRWFIFRKKFKDVPSDNVIDEKTAYMLARRNSGSRGASGLDLAPSEDELRKQRFDAYLWRKNEEARLSGSILDSDRTRIDDQALKHEGEEGELALQNTRSRDGDENDRVWDPRIVAEWTGRGEQLPPSPGPMDPDTPFIAEQDWHSPPLFTGPTALNASNNPQPPQVHKHMESVEVPLLSAGATHRHNTSDPVDDIPPLQLRPDSFPPLPSAHDYNAPHGVEDEFGIMDSTTSMAGIGSASRRRSRVGSDPRFRNSISSGRFDSHIMRDSLVTINSRGPVSSEDASNLSLIPTPSRTSQNQTQPLPPFPDQHPRTSDTSPFHHSAAT